MLFPPFRDDQDLTRGTLSYFFLDRCDENAFSLSYVIDQQRAVEAQASLEAMALDGNDALAQ